MKITGLIRQKAGLLSLGALCIPIPSVGDLIHLSFIELFQAGKLILFHPTVHCHLLILLIF
jgi:hypothetical protein